MKKNLKTNIDLLHAIDHKFKILLSQKYIIQNEILSQLKKPLKRGINKITNHLFIEKKFRKNYSQQNINEFFKKYNPTIWPFEKRWVSKRRETTNLHMENPKLFKSLIKENVLWETPSKPIFHIKDKNRR